MFDFVLFEKGLNINNNPVEHITWKTKSFRDPMMRLHYISEDGFLHRAIQEKDNSGVAKTYGPDGTFSFLDVVGSKYYTGHPEEYTLDWEKIRYEGEMIIQGGEVETAYSLQFEHSELVAIEELTDENTPTQIEPGDIVYDKETNTYVVKEIINERADKFIVREEVTERGHTIYPEKTVHDMNPSYPRSDIVVRVQIMQDGEEVGTDKYWPLTRAAKNIEDIL